MKTIVLPACLLFGCLLAVAYFSSSESFAPHLPLNEALYLLRAGRQPEWSEFSREAHGRDLNVSFEVAAGGRPRSLRMRQRDVRGVWKLVLNGHDLGKLPAVESDLVSYWRLPDHGLLEGINTLEVVPVGDRADDIVVGGFELDFRPVEEILSEARVSIEIVDAETRQPLPGRVTVVDAEGSLVPVLAESTPPLAVTHGMVYAADGTATFRVPAGAYMMYASRGFEYSVSAVPLRLAPGDQVRELLEIKREVPTAGYVSVDTHTHTFTHSGHGDASVEDRVISAAGEGIDVVVATEHNRVRDYGPAARRLGLDASIQTIVGTELTTRVGHFSVFPIDTGARLPSADSRNWPQLLSRIRRTPGVSFVVLNHPRDQHAGHRPFGAENFNASTAVSRSGWRFDVDGLEVVNSGAIQSDPLRLYRDWFALLNRGYRMTPVGASDSHDVGRVLVGQARTYVACEETALEQPDPDCVVAGLKKGKVLVSMGLLTHVSVEERYGPGDLLTASGDVEISVEVLGPTWASARRVLLFANGSLIRQASIPPASDEQIRKWQGEWKIPKPRHDMHLVAVALGPGVTAPYWRISKPHQPSTPDWEPYILGSTGVVWVDADGDGRFSSAYEYAQQLVKESGGNRAMLRRQLELYDEAVSIQVAALLGDTASRRKRRLPDSP